MNRTVVLTKEADSTSARDRRRKKIVAATQDSKDTGKFLYPLPGVAPKVDLLASPPKIVIPPNKEYLREPPSPESKKYFGLNAMEQFNRQAQWLKHRSEIAEVSPIERAMGSLSLENSPVAGQIAMTEVKPRKGLLSRQAFNDDMFLMQTAKPPSSRSRSRRGLRDGDKSHKKKGSKEESSKSISHVGGVSSPSPVDPLLLRQDSISSLMAMEPAPLTPRSRYIENCFKDKLNPRAFLVLRKLDTTELRLNHLGIGDKLGKAVADSFKDLPLVQLIDIADNNFTDKALEPIVKAIRANKTITYLDISQNTVGPKAADALAAYLSTPGSALQTMIAKCADVDDFEAQKFLLNLTGNTTLTELDLSNNLLGVSENLNAVRPDIVTAGKAFAELLRLPTCALRTLKLGWNMIRMNGATDLCKSIGLNNSLTFLDINYNAIGHEGGIALGNSLLHNCSLQTLLLSTNAVDAMACLTICAGALENKHLKELVLDGNPICEQGARAAMFIPVLGTSNINLSLQNCNVANRDPHCSMNFSSLCKTYDLTLSDPYQRAVAILLLRIVACHHTYLISRCDYEERKGSKSFEKVNLTAFWLEDKVAYFDESRKRLQEGLLRLLDACEHEAAAKQYYDYVDVDKSGELDREEFGDLLSEIGIDLDDERLDDVFEQYDLDRGGTIGLLEFLVFLKRERVHAERRLRDLSQSPAFCSAKNPGERYLPPNKGRLILTVVDGFQRKSIYRTLTNADRHMLDKAASSPHDQISLILHAISGVKLVFDDALCLYNMMASESHAKVRILAAILPQLDNTTDGRTLVSKAIDGNRMETLALKRSLGAAIKPLTGTVNGYYNLDLSKELERICLIRLLELSRTREQKRASQSLIGEGRVPDLSQKGTNNSCFRNEVYNGAPITIDDKFANPIPSTGVLSFDYCGGDRMSIDNTVATDVRVVKSLVDCFLISRRSLDQALRKLKVLKALSDQTIQADGNTVFEVDWDTSREISDHQANFYEHLTERQLAMSDATLSEVITTNYELEVMEKFDLNPNKKAPEKIIASVRSIGGLGLSKPGVSSKPVAAKVLTFSGEVGDQSEKKTGGPMSIKLQGVSSKSGGSTGASSSFKSPRDTSKSPRESGKARESSKLFRAMSGKMFASGKAATEVSISQKAIQTNPFLTLYEDVVDEIIGEVDITEDNAICPGSLLITDDGKSIHELVDANGYPIRLRAPITRSTSIGRTDLSSCNSAIKLTTETRRGVLEFNAKFSAMMLSEEITARAKAARVVELIEDVFSKLWLYSRHVALIMELFCHIGSLKRTDYFGSYRVDACVTLLERVVDLHNVELILRVLTPFEIACLYCRIGWLNLFNPMKPEGSYTLNLALYEERVVCKLLCALKMNEPGETLKRFEFSWERGAEPVPKCDLVEAWMTDQGLPRRGFVYLSYYGGSGRNVRNCHPNSGFRKSLLQMVLIEEEDVILDEDRNFSWESILAMDANSVNPSVEKRNADRIARIAANPTLWRNYLVPGHGASGQRSKGNRKEKEKPLESTAA